MMLFLILVFICFDDDLICFLKLSLSFGFLSLFLGKLLDLFGLGIVIMLSSCESNDLSAFVYTHHTDTLCDTSHNTDIACKDTNDNTIA